MTAAVGSVAKALTLLRTLIDIGGEGSLANLSRLSGLPKSTAHRLLSVLEAQGAVIRTREGYCLGDFALRLGGWIDGDLHARLIRSVKPYLVELFEMSRHPVSLAVLCGNQVLYLDSLFGRAAVPSGRWAPAHSTAMGKVLLAFNPTAQERILGRVSLEPVTRYTIISPDMLAREIVGIRAIGIAAMRHENALGVVGLAAPVTGTAGVATAAIGVSGPEKRFDWVKVASMLRGAAYCASVAVQGCRARPHLATTLQWRESPGPISHARSKMVPKRP